LSTLAAGISGTAAGNVMRRIVARARGLDTPEYGGWSQKLRRSFVIDGAVQTKWWARQDSNLGPTDYEYVATGTHNVFHSHDLRRNRLELKKLPGSRSIRHLAPT